MMAAAMLRAGAVLDDDVGPAARARARWSGSARENAGARRRGAHPGRRHRPARRPGAGRRGRARRLRGHRRSRLARLGRARSWSGCGGTTGTSAGRASSTRRAGGAARKACCPRRVSRCRTPRRRRPTAWPAITCVRLHELTGDARWRERREALVGGVRRRAAGARACTRRPFCSRWTGTSIRGTHLVVDRPGGRRRPRSGCTGAALARFAPRRVVQRLTPARADAGRLPPALAGDARGRRGDARLRLRRDELPAAGRDARGVGQCRCGAGHG